MVTKPSQNMKKEHNMLNIILTCIELELVHFRRFHELGRTVEGR